MSTADVTHLSIGEVLALLQQEFPDVTISKIRFLESQGLINPERTPSGYRRFHEDDIGRLRWVLRQQRDHFLPLKVIKAKLDQGAGDTPAQQPLWSAIGDDGHPVATGGATPGAAPDDDGAGQTEQDPQGASPPAEHPAAPTDADAAANGAMPEDVEARSVDTDSITGAAGESVAEALGSRSDPSRRPAPASRRDPGAWLTELQEAPRRGPATPQASVTGAATTADHLLRDLTSDRLTRDELVERSGQSIEMIEELEEFGLIRGRVIGGEDHYDAAALEVIATAAQFAALGIEARHLRSYRLSVDRESSFIEQLVLPLLKQRNPQARVRAEEALERYAELGGDLRRALLRVALGPHFH